MLKRIWQTISKGHNTVQGGGSLHFKEKPHAMTVVSTAVVHYSRDEQQTSGKEPGYYRLRQYPKPHFPRKITPEP